MLNKDFLKDSITLFSRYTSLKKNDPTFSEQYKNMVIPTFIEYCSFNDSNIYHVSKVGNTSLGDVSLTFSFNSDATIAYRFIENKKVYLKYIDEALYNIKGNDEQFNKYFTLSKTLVFVKGLKTELANEISIADTMESVFKESGWKRYTLDMINDGHSGTDIVIVSGKIG